MRFPHTTPAPVTPDLTRRAEKLYHPGHERPTKRPDVRDAVDPETAAQLTAAFAEVERDPACSYPC